MPEDRWPEAVSKTWATAQTLGEGRALGILGKVDTIRGLQQRFRWASNPPRGRRRRKHQAEEQPLDGDVAAWLRGRPGFDRRDYVAVQALLGRLQERRHPDPLGLLGDSENAIDFERRVRAFTGETLESRQRRLASPGMDVAEILHAQRLLPVLQRLLDALGQYDGDEEKTEAKRRVRSALSHCKDADEGQRVLSAFVEAWGINDLTVQLNRIVRTRGHALEDDEEVELAPRNEGTLPFEFTYDENEFLSRHLDVPESTIRSLQDGERKDSRTVARRLGALVVIAPDDGRALEYVVLLKKRWGITGAPVPLEAWARDRKLTLTQAREELEEILFALQDLTRRIQGINILDPWDIGTAALAKLRIPRMAPERLATVLGQHSDPQSKIKAGVNPVPADGASENPETTVRKLHGNL